MLAFLTGNVVFRAKGLILWMGAHKERKGEETPDPFTGFLCVLHKIKTYKKT